MVRLSVCAPEFFPDGTSAEDALSADENRFNTEPLATDEGIIEYITDAEGSANAGNDDDSDGDDDDASEETVCPKATDVQNALEILREYMISSKHVGEIQRNLNRITTLVEEEFTDKYQQTDIRSSLQ